MEFSDKIISAIDRCPKVSAPCHNDLIAANFIQSRDQLYLLDWEYAGMGHPYVDLGNCAVNFCMDEAGCRTLMEAYLGREPTPAEMARLRLWKRLTGIGAIPGGLNQVEKSCFIRVGNFVDKANKF